jgi:hypothetical protein
VLCAASIINCKKNSFQFVRFCDTCRVTDVPLRLLAIHFNDIVHTCGHHRFLAPLPRRAARQNKLGLGGVLFERQLTSSDSDAIVPLVTLLSGKLSELMDDAVAGLEHHRPPRVFHNPKLEALTNVSGQGTPSSCFHDLVCLLFACFFDLCFCSLFLTLVYICHHSAVV